MQSSVPVLVAAVAVAERAERPRAGAEMEPSAELGALLPEVPGAAAALEEQAMVRK